MLGYAVAIAVTQDDSFRTVVFDVTSPMWSLLASASFLYAGWLSKPRSPRLGASFYILALALLLNSLGDLTWAIYQDGFGMTPFPSLADAFYLAYYPVFFIAILHLPALGASRREALVTFQDISIVLLASILCFWNFVLGPVFQSSVQEPLTFQALSLAYPVCDLVLLWAVVLLVFRKPDGASQVPMLVLGAAASLFFLTDCLYSYQSVLGVYASGGYLDIGWIGAYLLFALAAILQAASVQEERRTNKPSGAYLTVQHLNGLVAYMPYIWLVVAFMMLVVAHYRPMAMDFRWMALGVGAIIMIVLFRQLTTLQENSRLFHQLRGALDQLQKQAAMLSATNRELQNEIGERQHAEKQLAFTALHDSLTGLPNRAHLVDRLEQVLELARHRSYACKLLYLDLDKFKEINDSLGHGAGDEVLIRVAERLQSCLRSRDMVARFGGDEFVILLEDFALDVGCHPVRQPHPG